MTAIPLEEQNKINRQKLLMEDDKAELFQSFCENIFAEKGTSDKQKAKKLENAWLYCLGIGVEERTNPFKLAGAVKGIISRAKKRDVKPKAFEKLRAMLGMKRMFRRR